MDIEKTFFGLADGCATAGKAGCRLVEVTGDNASGEDVKDLITYSHDVNFLRIVGVDDLLIVL